MSSDDRWISTPSFYSVNCYNCEHHKMTEVWEVMRVRDTGRIEPSDTQCVFLLYPNDAHCELGQHDFGKAWKCNHFKSKHLNKY